MERDQQLEAALRLLGAQRHSFANHLQVISGYLQINRIDRTSDYLKNAIAEIMAEGILHKALAVSEYLWFRNELEELELSGVRVSLGLSLCTAEPEEFQTISLAQAWQVVKEQLLLVDVSCREIVLELTDTAGAIFLNFVLPWNKIEAEKERMQYYTRTDSGNIRLRIKLKP